MDEMTDEELLFQQWWTIECQEAAFEETQCHLAFLKGIAYWKAYSAVKFKEAAASSDWRE